MLGGLLGLMPGLVAGNRGGQSAAGDPLGADNQIRPSF
jgi:hypothetical protein